MVFQIFGGQLPFALLSRTLMHSCPQQTVHRGSNPVTSRNWSRSTDTVFCFGFHFSVFCVYMFASINVGFYIGILYLQHVVCQSQSENGVNIERETGQPGGKPSLMQSRTTDTANNFYFKNKNIYKFYREVNNLKEKIYKREKTCI